MVINGQRAYRGPMSEFGPKFVQEDGLFAWLLIVYRGQNSVSGGFVAVAVIHSATYRPINIAGSAAISIVYR